MFFDRFHTAGFKANIVHQGGTVYRAEALSNGIISTTVSFVEWFNSVLYNKNPFVDGGSSLNNGEIIRDAAEIIYTPRKAGVIIGHDIRTDKWELRAMSKMTLDVDKLNHREKLINPEGDDTPAA